MTLLFLIAAAALLALLLAAGLKPDTFRVERSIAIKASPDDVHAHLSDFRKWADWSPWEKMDQDLKRTYSGAAAGKGTVYEWEGNRKVGQGRMEILESSPQRVVIRLDFIKPFKACNTAEFTLAPKGEGTDVTWAMYGPNLYIGKLMSCFFNMDKAIGRDFEAGLSNLKSTVETSSRH